MPPVKKKKKKTAAWMLYVLQCRDKTLYTGITTDLSRRVSSTTAAQPRTIPEAGFR